MRILGATVYLDMVLLAEEKPDEEEVRLPSPGLGIILIFCSIPWPCCCFVPCFSSLVPFTEVLPLGGLTASMLARGLFRPDFSGIPSLPGLFRPDEDPPPAIFLGLFSWEPGSGIELTLAGEAGVEVTLGVCCFCCCLNLNSCCVPIMISEAPKDLNQLLIQSRSFYHIFYTPSNFSSTNIYLG